MEGRGQWGGKREGPGEREKLVVKRNPKSLGKSELCSVHSYSGLLCCSGLLSPTSTHHNSKRSWSGNSCSKNLIKPYDNYDLKDNFHGRKAIMPPLLLTITWQSDLLLFHISDTRGWCWPCQAEDLGSPELLFLAFQHLSLQPHSLILPRTFRQACCLLNTVHFSIVIMIVSNIPLSIYINGGQMAQAFRVLAALLENPVLIPEIHKENHNHL